MRPARGSAFSWATGWFSAKTSHAHADGTSPFPVGLPLAQRSPFSLVPWRFGGAAFFALPDGTSRSLGGLTAAQ
eukprot:1763543-Pyramimonas_sp.AAC.1